MNPVQAFDFGKFQTKWQPSYVDLGLSTLVQHTRVFELLGHPEPFVAAATVKALLEPKHRKSVLGLTFTPGTGIAALNNNDPSPWGKLHIARGIGFSMQANNGMSVACAETLRVIPTSIPVTLSFSAYGNAGETHISVDFHPGFPAAKRWEIVREIGKFDGKERQGKLGRVSNLEARDEPEAPLVFRDEPLVLSLRRIPGANTAWRIAAVELNSPNAVNLQKLADALETRHLAAAVKSGFCETVKIQAGHVGVRLIDFERSLVGGFNNPSIDRDRLPSQFTLEVVGASEFGGPEKMFSHRSVYFPANREVDAGGEITCGVGYRDNDPNANGLVCVDGAYQRRVGPLKELKRGAPSLTLSFMPDSGPLLEAQRRAMVGGVCLAFGAPDALNETLTAAAKSFGAGELYNGFPIAVSLGNVPLNLFLEWRDS